MSGIEQLVKINTTAVSRAESNVKQAKENKDQADKDFKTTESKLRTRDKKAEKKSDGTYKLPKKTTTKKYKRLKAYNEALKAQKKAQTDYNAALDNYTKVNDLYGSANRTDKTFVYENTLIDAETQNLRSQNIENQNALKGTTQKVAEAELAKQKAKDKAAAKAQKYINSSKTSKELKERLNKADGGKVSTKGLKDKDLKKAERYNALVDKAKTKTSELKIAQEKQQEAADKAATSQADYASQVVKAEQEKFNNVKKYYDSQNDYLDSLLSKQESANENKEAKGIKLTSKDYKNLQKTTNQQITNKQDEKTSLEEQLRKSVKSGVIKKGSEEWKAMKAEITGVETEIGNLTKRQTEYNNTIAQMPFDKIEEQLDYLDTLTGVSQSRQSLKEAQGISLTASDYQKDININNKKLAQYQKEYNTAMLNAQKAAANPDGVFGGKTAQEWKKNAKTYEKSMIDIATSNQQLTNSIIEIPFQKIAKQIEYLDSILDVINAKQNVKTSQGLMLTASDIQKEINYTEKLKSEYQNEYNEYMENVGKAEADPKGRYGDKTVKEWKTLARQAEKQILDAEASINESNNAIVQLPFDRISKQLDYIESFSNLLESEQSLKTTRGIMLEASDYKKAMAYNDKMYKQYQNEYNLALQNAELAKNDSSGTWGGKSQKEWRAEANEYAQSMNQMKISNEEYANSIVQIPFDKIAKEIDYLSSLSDILQSEQSIKTAKGLLLDANDYRESIAMNNDIIAQYREQYNLAMKNAAIAESSADGVNGGKTAQEWRTEANGYIRSINDMEEANINYANSIINIPFEKMERELEYLISLADLLKSRQDILTAKGIDLTESDYKESIAMNNRLITQYQNERDEAIKNMRLAMSDPEGVYGGKTAQEWETMANGYEKSVNEMTEANIEFNNSIIQIPFDQIAKQIDYLSSLSDVLKSQQSILTTRGIALTYDNYQDSIEMNTQMMEQYLEEYKQAIENANLAEADAEGVYGGKSAQQWRTEANGYISSVNEMKQANEELSNSIVQIPFERINKEIEYINSLISVLKSQQAISTTRGIMLTVSDYQDTIAKNNDLITQYMEEYTEAVKNANAASLDPDGVYGGKTIQEWKTEANNYISSINEMKAANEELTNSIVQIPFEKIRKEIEYLTSLSDVLKSKQNIKTTRGLMLSAYDYGSEIEANSMLMAQYQAEYEEAINNAKLAAMGSENVYGGKTAQEWETEANGYLKSVNDMKNANEELSNSIIQIPFDRITKEIKSIESQISYNESVLSLKKALGTDLDEADYLAKISNNMKLVTKYEAERYEAYENYRKALASEDDVYGGKSSQDWLSEYNTYGTSLNNIYAEIEEIRDALRDDVYWRSFERAHDACKKLKTLLEGINDLIDDEAVFDTNGNFTDLGIAKIANLAKSFENSRNDISNYSNDIRNLNELYKQGLYTEEEYSDKLEEIQDNILQTAADMKSYQDTIIEMYKDIAKSELDALNELIDKRAKAIEKKKELTIGSHLFNCWDSLKTNKPQHKDEIYLSVMVA